MIPRCLVVRCNVGSGETVLYHGRGGKQAEHKNVTSVLTISVALQK